MNNDFWNHKGCEYCRSDAVSSGNQALVRNIATADLLYLHKCKACGTYWEENLREMHPIEREQVAKDFPNYLSE